jgi:hypothetical protein
MSRDSAQRRSRTECRGQPSACAARQAVIRAVFRVNARIQPLSREVLRLEAGPQVDPRAFSEWKTVGERPRASLF